MLECQECLLRSKSGRAQRLARRTKPLPVCASVELEPEAAPPCSISISYEEGLEEQLTCEAVDCAAETSPWADCEMSFTASCTEASLGTFLSDDVKLSQALSSEPVGAFCTA